MEKSILNKLVLQNEAEHQENPVTTNNFAHDASMGMLMVTAILMFL